MTMTKQEAIEKICAAISEKFDNNFPCICGMNAYSSPSDTLCNSDKDKLELVINAIKNIKVEE